MSLTAVSIGGETFPAVAPVPRESGQRPFWSVVVPVYNRSEFIRECLASVLGQFPGESEMEVLVVDDASTLPIQPVVSSIPGHAVRYHRNSRTSGLPANWNIGLSLTRGHWIHVLHDDDYVLPGFYAQLRDALETCPESVGAAFTGYENIDERGSVVFRQQAYGPNRGIAKDWLNSIGVANPLNMPAVVVRRTIYERIGAYHPELTYTSDWELYKRIAVFAEWWSEPNILARYRQHSRSKTSELFLSGGHAVSIRRAIEMSYNYLPPDRREDLTNRSRRHYFDLCLSQLAMLVGTGNAEAALELAAEALRINHTPQAQAKLFRWLAEDGAAPVRQLMVQRLFSTR